MSSHNGKWVHIVATYSGNESTSGIKIYLNATRSDEDDLSAGTYTGMTATTSPVYIGNRPDFAKWKGYMDDVRLFNAELTATQATNLYTQGRQ